MRLGEARILELELRYGLWRSHIELTMLLFLNEKHITRTYIHTSWVCEVDIVRVGGLTALLEREHC